MKKHYNFFYAEYLTKKMKVVFMTFVIMFFTSISFTQTSKLDNPNENQNIELALGDYIYENGIWTPQNPSGVSTNLDNIIVVDGTASLTANTVVSNLTIEAGATLNVNKVLKLFGNLTIDGDLVFVSSATSNGELDVLAGTSMIIGEATVERYMQDKRSYRMVSSAVTTTTSIHDNWQEGATSNTDNPVPGF